MTTLRDAARQALEALEYENSWHKPRNEKPYVSTLDAITALKAALAQEQDAELSAALGWPGGVSTPALDRKRLLKMVAALRVSAQQALEAWDAGDAEWFMRAYTVMDALRAALAEPVQENKDA